MANQFELTAPLNAWSAGKTPGRLGSVTSYDTPTLARPVHRRLIGRLRMRECLYGKQWPWEKHKFNLYGYYMEGSFIC